jgi:hypothetical protein
VDLARERGMGERLPDQINSMIQPAVVHDGVAGVTRGEQHEKVGPAATGLIGQLLAVQTARQPDIGEQQADGRLSIEDP